MTYNEIDIEEVDLAKDYSKAAWDIIKSKSTKKEPDKKEEKKK